MDRQALPEVIRTTRLELRAWKLNDVDDVLSYAKDEEWKRYLHLIPSPYERVHAEQFVAQQVLLDRVTHPSWAIVLEGQVIGGINFRFDFSHRLGEVGYSIARDHWNHGYMTEVVAAVIDIAFSSYPDLNRIRAFADVGNEASKRVMEKIGMKLEGVLRQNRVERGVVVDEAWFGMLRSEWSARFG